MKKFALLMCLLVVVCSCNNTSKNTPEAFDQLLEDYYQESLELYRLPSTYLGESRYNDSLPNFLSADFSAKEIAFNNKYATAVNEFPNESLSSSQQLSKKLLLWETNMALEAKNFKKHLIPIDQMWSFHLNFGQLASGQGAQPFATEQDYANWLIRIEGYLQWMQSAEDNMRKGMETGWVLPIALIKKVIPQFETNDY